MKTNLILRISAAAFLSATFLNPVAAQTAPNTNLPGKEQLSSALTTYQTIAEKKFYIKAYGFYALLAPGGFHGQGAPPPTESRFSNALGNGSTTNSSSDYNFKDSFGSGLRVGGGIGQVINDFINLGIDGEYVLGSQTTESYFITSQKTYYDNSTSSTTKKVAYTTSNELKYDYRIFNIIPNITFKAISKPEYYIYNRLGLIIGMPTKLSYTHTATERKGAAREGAYSYLGRATYDLEEKTGLGYQAALGVQFRISESLRGFAEVVVSNQQVKSNKSILTDAQDKGKGEDSFQKIDFNDIDEAEKVKTGMNLTMPVNSIGLSVGLALRF